MVTLSCTASRENGVTLVTGRVENAGEPRRVRLTSRLDGPLWPPRRQGVPERGWDDDGFECVLGADEVRPFGAASPAPPVEQPVTVAESEPVDGDDGTVEPRVAVPSVDATADAVVRTLGTPRPPRDAVPTPEPAEPNRSRTVKPESDAPGASAAPEPDDAEADRSAATADRPAEAEAIAATLDAVATRVETADRLSTTTRVRDATEALQAVGGLAGARDLDAQLARDAERLAQLATRASELAERAEAATVPVERLDRVR